MNPIQTPQATSIPPPVSDLQTPPPTPKPKLNSRLLLVIATLTGLLLASFAVVYVLQAQQNNTTPTPVTRTTPSPTPDPTANWKTYENKKYNYSFRYPTTWTLGGNEEAALLYNKLPIVELNYVVEIYPSTYSQNSATIEDPIGTRREIGDKIFETKIADLTIDGRPAGKFTIEVGQGSQTDARPGTVVKVKNGQNLLVLKASSQDKSVLDIFDQMLSTFKFTDQTSSNSAENVKNLPKEQCGCWDGVNNTCLSQSACL